MDKQIKKIEFPKLRFAYITVKRFLESESFMEVKSLNSKIADDLCMTGDDNYDLLVKFVEKFDLEHKGFEYNNHFYSEGELYGSEPALINLLNLSVWIPMKTIELLTFNKIKLNKPELYQPDRQVTDMTFRDFLTWYIEGSFVSSKELKYEIKNGTQQRV